MRALEPQAQYFPICQAITDLMMIKNAIMTAIHAVYFQDAFKFLYVFWVLK